jgi:8-oxo-dGTP pyrophosphatase MutT (NUDIX family)
METTRHFVATVYVVNDGATALHEHERLGLTLPPGGHVDRDELPHEAARREAGEEIGQEPTIVSDHPDVTSGTSRSIPRPRHVLLEDINVHDGDVGHQHVDFVFYGHVETREIEPAEMETSADAWAWYDREDLLAADDLPDDVIELGQEAIDAVEEYRS